MATRRTPTALLCLIVLAGALLWAAPAAAFHFPWDQGHDTFNPDHGDDDTDPGDDGPCQSGSPVEFATGNFVHQETDLLIPGRGPRLELVRIYNSRDMRRGIFGVGWSFTFDQRLSETTDGVTLHTICHQGDGKRERFRRETDGSYVSPPFLSSRLVKNADGTFTIFDRGGARREFDAVGRLTSVGDRNQNRVTIDHDATGFPTSITDPTGRVLSFTKGPDGRVASVSAPGGRIHRYGYDSAGNLAWSQDPLGFTTQYSYDAKHNLIRVTDPRGHRRLQASYDTSERVATLTSGEETWTFSYLSTQKRTDRTDSGGKRWSYFYDTTGSVIRVVDPLTNQESYTFNGDRRLAAFTDKNGRVTTFAYDAQGNPKEIVDPEGRLHRLSFDAADRLVSTTDPAGRETRFEYDARGNLVRMVEPLAAITEFVYDLAGQLSKVSDSTGGETLFAYDVNGYLTEAVDPSGRRTSYSYDEAGNRIEYQDGLGNTTQYEHDLMDRLVRVVNGLNATTSYEYDAAGNVTSVTDPKGEVLRFEYDAFDRMTKAVDRGGRERLFTYDRKGNVVGMTAPDGVVTSYVYDPLSRLLQKQAPDNLTRFTYDRAGNVLTASDGDSGLTMTYDPLGRLTQVRTLATAHQPASTISYGFDERNRRATMTDPLGEVTTWSFDARHRPIDIASPLGAFGFEWDALSRRTRTTYPSGAVSEVARDPAGRVIRVLHSSTAGLAADLSIGYDPAGLVVSIVDGGVASSFAHDAVSRLVSAAHEDPARADEWYSYDAAGNRLGSHLSNVGIYDSDDRLLENEGFLFGYDANGNLATKTEKATGAVTSYRYDSDNQLVRVDLPDGGFAEYRYDVRGRRIEKNVNGSVRRFVYSGEDLLVAYDSAGVAVARYAHGPGVDEPLAVRSGDGAVTFYHRDGLGSVLSLTDSVGQPVESLRYDSFGRSVGEPPSESTFGYTGRELDPETGLYYYRSRHYDPDLGRFLQPDPIRFVGSGTDFYAYVLNSPLHWTDPFGLQPCGPEWLDWLQTALDLGGLIPGVGEPLDLLNGAIYGLRGDYLNAGLSAAAAIPFAGWGATGAKLGLKGLGDVASGSTSVRQALDAADRWLGPGYREIAPGVYRSSDGTRQFRMTDSDLGHANPHVHFESIGPDGRTITENGHVYLTDP